MDGGPVSRTELRMPQGDHEPVPPEIPASQPSADAVTSPEEVAAAATSAPGSAHAAPADPYPPLTVADIAAHLSLRDVVLRAYPDVVAELVQGETLAELFATLPRAQAAWQRVAARVDASAVSVASGASASGADADDGSQMTSATLPASERGVAPALPPSVAGGSPVRSGQPGLEHLTPLARIRAGLRTS
jgi:hypothetical protein